MCITPVICDEYLYNVLKLLPSQRIDSITINQVVESNTALTIKFAIIIKEDGHTDKKQSLFIKTIKCDAKENVYHDLSIKEAEFYKLIRNKSISFLPIVHCFDVYISEDKTKYLILLQDVSDIYIDSNQSKFTEKGVWFSAAESLANFHSTFWNLKEIDLKNLPVNSIEALNTHINDTYNGFGIFKDYIGNRFDNATYAIYEHVVNINVALLKENYERKLNNSNITIVHGDSHIYNFMLSTNKNLSPVIIDFQFWGVGIGAGDLAHLTRVSFPDEFSISLHEPLIRKYYNTLLEQGVQGYSWEECWIDYRKRVAVMLLIPMWQYTGFDLKYDDWINDIPKLLLNYNALECNQIKV